MQKKIKKIINYILHAKSCLFCVFVPDIYGLTNSIKKWERKGRGGVVEKKICCKLYHKKC